MSVVCCLILVSLGIGYGFLLFYMLDGWNKLHYVHIPIDTNKEKRGVSILIAVRNEAQNIVHCIESILSNDVDGVIYEIVIINDHSDDNTADLVQNLTSDIVKLIHLPDAQSGKKAAISYGVSMARYDMILCTDGDSKVSNKWIKYHSNLLSSGCNMVTGLVLPECGNDYLSKFQYLDFVATMCITANGFQRHSYHLANGANMSFKKAFFDRVSGFEGNENVASGDDLFLMKKAVALDNTKVGFLKSMDSIVETKSEPTWQALINQRKRWATKSMKVGDQKVILIQGLVFLYCVTTLAILLTGLFFSQTLFLCGILMFFWKMAIDFWFLRTLTNYFGKNGVLKSFFVLSLIYFIHILYSGFSALFPSAYIWKERVKKL